MELKWSLPSGRVGIVVLESTPELNAFQCAAILVPQGREADWIFSSQQGQEQLLASSGVSMLIVVSREGIPSCQAGEWELRDGGQEEVELKQSLHPLLVNLVRNRTSSQIHDVPFACYQDGVISSRVVEQAFSPRIGPMLVEDVRLESGELRRRLRFKSLPNLIQTEVPLRQDHRQSATRIDHGVLVHAYLAPLVAGFSLISRCLESCSSAGRPARVLCIGVGGGALPMFLSTTMDAAVAAMDVVAVDVDEVVVDVARRHFGLVPSGNLRIRVEDGLDTLEKVAEPLQVVVVDVSDGSKSCPPSAFVEAELLLAARSALDEGGMLAMNVMPQGGEESHRVLLRRIARVFGEVYQLRVCDGDNFAVFALKNPLQGLSVPVTCKIGNLIGDALLNHIYKVESCE